MLFVSLPSWITCERLYPSIERAEPGKKMEKNRKGYDRGRKSLYINRLEAVFGGHRRRISPGNWVKRVFPGDLFPTKIATFDQRRSPLFFYTLHLSACFLSKVKRFLSMTLTRYSKQVTRKLRTLEVDLGWTSRVETFESFHRNILRTRLYFDKDHI